MGARNVHALAATVRRLEEEAARGKCALHPDRDAVGSVTPWTNRPRGCCAACARRLVKEGRHVHRRGPDA